MSTATSETTPADELHAEPHHTHPTDASYIKIALFLAVVTGAEVATYYVDLSTAALLAVLMPRMVVKFAVVAMFFMHLRFDSRLFRRLFVTGLVLAVAVYMIVLSTFEFFG
jgi:cytochrome c oxidase subunit 4